MDRAATSKLLFAKGLVLKNHFLDQVFHKCDFFTFDCVIVIKGHNFVFVQEFEASSFDLVRRQISKAVVQNLYDLVDCGPALVAVHLTEIRLLEKVQPTFELSQGLEVPRQNDRCRTERRHYDVLFCLDADFVIGELWRNELLVV